MRALPKISRWMGGRERSPFAQLLEGIRERGNPIQAIGGLAVIRTTFDRRAEPREALHWMNGVAFEDDGMVTVATHTFVGSGHTNCSEATCGSAIIDSNGRGGDRLVEKRGTITDLDAAESVLHRINTDIAGRNGDPVTSYLATVVLMRFHLLEHGFDAQSPVLGGAAGAMLDHANRFPAYYDEALAA